MLKRLRSRLHGEGGFTLIELLVVILIIGILAAIAIPSFLNQKSKGEDANTKSQARNAQTAMETYATDQGDYTAATVAKLQAIEPSITLLTGVTASNGTSTSTPTATGYRVVATGASGRMYWVDKSGATVNRGCSVPPNTDPGGCKNASNSSATTTGTW